MKKITDFSRRQLTITSLIVLFAIAAYLIGLGNTIFGVIILLFFSACRNSNEADTQRRIEENQEWDYVKQ